ncbi:hypothetical protein EIB71_01290 [Kaistella daneshvariae]|jgi:hypothetical protein|uniref:Uncharacterized protein n=2 Tax=Kaistella daneshvariae TaxID=2487074 RepID=A0ABM7C616_9FLAO|nr:hypothetical protein [Kaistella daneshvariae]AZI66394.1 hypothetical protein EIB71_01290 [Kaistella daneshvariae]
MTRSNLFTKIQMLALAVMANFAVILVKAQESAPDLKVDVNTDGGMAGGNWMSNPLIWVIGALVLIVLIAIVARGNGNK